MEIKRGLYYEDYKVGGTIKSQGRTVTEADIVNFSGFTGDFSSLHVDREYAKGIHFKKRIAHGMLTMSMATGLAVMSGILEDTIIAFESISDWQFKRPVFINDTVHIEISVASKQERVLRGGFKAGHVTTNAKVFNQDGKIVQQGTWSMLIKKSL